MSFNFHLQLFQFIFSFFFLLDIFQFSYLLSLFIISEVSVCVIWHSIQQGPSSYTGNLTKTAANSFNIHLHWRQVMTTGNLDPSHLDIIANGVIRTSLRCLPVGGGSCAHSMYSLVFWSLVVHPFLTNCFVSFLYQSFRERICKDCHLHIYISIYKYIHTHVNVCVNLSP